MVILSKTNRPQTERPANKLPASPKHPHVKKPVGSGGRGQPPGQRNCGAKMATSSSSNDNAPSRGESGPSCHSSGASVATPSSSAATSQCVLAASSSDNVPMAPPGGSVGSPSHDRMPSIRPNAMRNRQKLLEVLQRYEDRIKTQKHDRSLANEPVAAILNMMAPTVQSVLPVHPMHMHVLDISGAISEQCVSWRPLDTNCDGNAPEETIFYSLIEGRGELIMFGGIQTDLGSMQRGVDVKQQTVSNSVHFLRAEHVLR